MTVPQVRVALAALLREALDGNDWRRTLRTMGRKLLRKELARLYHWKSRNRLAPLRLEGGG